jgi:hypothetical protein
VHQLPDLYADKACEHCTGTVDDSAQVCRGGQNANVLSNREGSCLQQSHPCCESRGGILRHVAPLNLSTRFLFDQLKKPPPRPSLADKRGYGHLVCTKLKRGERRFVVVDGYHSVLQ